MRRDDHGQSVVHGEPPDHFQHLADEFWIERRGGLVQQQHARIRRQRARNGYPLLLPAGKMPRQRVGAVAQSDPIEQVARAAVGVHAGHPMHPAQRSRDVFLCGQMAEQVELLEHHADADTGTLGGDIPRRQRPAVVAKAETASTDADGQVVGYLVQRNGVTLGQTSTTGFIATGLAPGTTYSFSVMAKDRAGHLSAPSSSLPVANGLRAVALAQILDLHRDIVAGDGGRALEAILPRNLPRRQRHDFR